MVGNRPGLRFATLITVVLVASFVDGGGGRPAAAAAAAEDQDLKARKLFAAGDYRQALEIYVNLYAETLHPTYLRNIGRCQQNLGEADKAIGSFREYLRKAKDLSPAQRQEIEGHIAEMEELKRKQAGGGAGSPSTSTSSTTGSTSSASGSGAAPPAPVALAAPPPATSGPAPTALLSSPAPAPADDGGSPFYTRVWFWVVVGAVAAGTVAAVFLLSRDTGPLDTLDLRGQTP